MNLNQRIFIIQKTQEKLKYKKLLQEYEGTFGTPCPTYNNVNLLIKKFLITGSVLNAKKSGRPRNAQFTMEEIREIITASPRVSLRTHERQLPMPRSTLQRLIKGSLKLRSYHFQVVHHLYPTDFMQRAQMCTELLRLWNLEDLKSNIIFSDEAVFHVCGRVNRHNSRIWASERPLDFIEHQTHTPKLNVWMAMSRRKVYGPYFF